jgi:hypothetical protein
MTGPNGKVTGRPRLPDDPDPRRQWRRESWRQSKIRRREQAKHDAGYCSATGRNVPCPLKALPPSVGRPWRLKRLLKTLPPPERRLILELTNGTKIRS